MKQLRGKSKVGRGRENSKQEGEWSVYKCGVYTRAVKFSDMRKAREIRSMPTFKKAYRNNGKILILDLPSPSRIGSKAYKIGQHANEM